VLHIHRAERADALVDALAEVLHDPPPDPFAPEVIAVPTRGMERWLTQRMSGRLGARSGRADGVCANIEFPFPGHLIGSAVAAASAIDPGSDEWLPERAVWPLLEVVDGCLAEPWLQSLALHLRRGSQMAGEGDPDRRFGSVRHLADLFDRYALHRPEMVRAWTVGQDTDGDGRDLPGDVAWQAELWRRLRERIPQADPAERREMACERLRRDPELVELPRRIALFGFTRLPVGHLHVLRALAASRDIHVFLLHPSPALWRRVAELIEHLPPIIRRSEDPTARLAANRLLASWGQDARELQLVLGAGSEQIDRHLPTAQGASTLLARIQADIRSDRAPPGAPLAGEEDARPPLDPGDRSVQVHSCHGRVRQVEVIREVILHLLDDDPSLEPRDVIVMCPDIETFAPLIHATFGAGETSDEEGEIDALPVDVRPADLHVRLADRSLRQTNAVLGVVGELLDLAGQRVTASQVLDLADREPVRRRFRFDDDDLARVREWIGASGIRWGFDARHRAPFKLDTLGAGTWRAGLDRILLGVTMTEVQQRLFADVLALDDVDSGAIDLVGRLAEFVDRLRRAVDALSGQNTIDAWALAIAEAADALTATTERDGWQHAELHRLLDEVVAEATAGEAVSQVGIALADVRSLLGSRLQGRPTRANFRTGHLTVCTLVPMRSVPHRVVCLLGLDDGSFPRKAPHDGDDLMVGDPHVGDRDARSEDRQMLLDALLAARDHLIVTYSGHDERTNLPRPPAVPVSELLDTVDATVAAGAADARGHVVVQHPLQPFDPRNFARGALVRDRTWGFDTVTLGGARAVMGRRSDPPPFLAEPLPPPRADLVEVENLVHFVQHPVRAFLSERLGISVRDFSDELEDDLPVELDALETWAVGQRLLEARLSGVEPRTAAMAEIARGSLPPGVLGKPVIEQVLPIVEGIVAAVGAVLDADPPSTDSLDVRLELPDARRLSGTIPGLIGDTLRTVTYSKVSPKHRLAAWVRLLALTAAHPDRPFAAATVGRAHDGTGVTIARIRPLGADPASRRECALHHLATLTDLYDRGMRAPLPLYCATSAAYVAAALAGGDAVAAGHNAWTTDWMYDREDREPEHQLVLGGQRTFDEVLVEPPRADEQGEGWEASETSRFGRCARRLWDGLLSCEEVSGA